VTDLVFDFGTVRLRARLRNTPTARAIAEALPLSATVSTWGEELYFDTPVSVAREADATDLVEPGELAFWCAGQCIALGFGPTPLSEGDEIRLAAATNVFADALDDVRLLAGVPAGATVRVSRLD